MTELIDTLNISSGLASDAEPAIPAALRDPQTPLTTDERKRYGLSYVVHEGRRLTVAECVMLGKLNKHAEQSQQADPKAAWVDRTIADSTCPQCRRVVPVFVGRVCSACAAAHPVCEHPEPSYAEQLDIYQRALADSRAEVEAGRAEVERLYAQAEQLNQTIVELQRELACRDKKIAHLQEALHEANGLLIRRSEALSIVADPRMWTSSDDGRVWLWNGAGTFFTPTAWAAREAAAETACDD